MLNITVLKLERTNVIPELGDLFTWQGNNLHNNFLRIIDGARQVNLSRLSEKRHVLCYFFNHHEN